MVAPTHSPAAEEAALLRRAAEFRACATLAELNPKALAELTRRHGVDFATALLYDRLRKAPAHAPFLARMEALLAAPPRALPAVTWKIAIVPGALHVERPDLGGDGKLVREVAAELGVPCEFVPLASRGSITTNAARLAAWLAPAPDDARVLVSLSKGGPEVKLALARPDAPRLFRGVVAWVNVCGPLAGSPLVDWVLASRVRERALRFQYWLRRRDFGFVSELRRAPAGPLAQPLRLPAGLRLVSLVGFPLRRHLRTPFSRFCHRVIARTGPNDGTALLADACSEAGEIFPVWGADHYFQPPSRGRALIVAVLHRIARGPESS